jgi:ubiquinone/menaquinone biosynthesis C-methylase UbiE
MTVDEQNERRAFEQLVSSSASRPATTDSLAAELRRQTLYQPQPNAQGLNELAGLLERRFLRGDLRVWEEAVQLGRAFERQPLAHLYGFALCREAGATDQARASLDALLEVDPHDPIAAYFEAFLRSEPVMSADEEVRLSNIAKFAATPLLSNAYSLAVGLLFDAIRAREGARVLDIGIGSGAQMEILLRLLERSPHRVRRLEIVGLDLRPEFLAKAGERIAAAASALAGRVEVTYEPIEGRVEALSESAIATVRGRGVDAANATIALHEVAGEAKLAALSTLRRIAPGRLVIAEWNYCLENVLAETSPQFVFNVRSVAAAMVAALRDRHTVEESRAVVRDWLSQGDGQLTCPSGQRQECFLDITSWRALLGRRAFTVAPADPRWLEHAAQPDQARIAKEGWYLSTWDLAGASPIALVVAAPGSDVSESDGSSAQR